MTHTAYIGIGSNIGNRIEHILNALDRLDSEIDIKLVKASPIYESEALDSNGLRSEDPPYMNAAAQIKTNLEPEPLLRITQRIERDMGRPINRSKNAPRTIDLDILLYDDLVLKADALTIPHPRMAKRMFVLAPMSDIAPELTEPVTQRTMAEMKAQLGDEGGRVEKQCDEYAARKIIGDLNV